MSDQATIAKYTPKPPQQVAAAALAADEVIRSLQTGQPPAEPQPPAPPAQPSAPQPQQASPPAQQPPPPAPLGEGETWEQRARSAQGRYENQVGITRQLTERMTELERSIATLQAAGAQPPAVDPNAPKPKLNLVTDQERTDYGDDFLQVVGKRAKEEYFPEFDDLARRLQRLEGRVDGTVQLVTTNAKQDFYAHLDSQVQGWRDVNRSPAFKQWLEFVDPFSGRKRHEMLMEAFSGHEAPRVVTFFRGFMSEATGTPPSQLNPPPTASSPQNGSTATTGGALTLEQLAAPGRARSAPQGNLSPDKPVYSHAWIAKFMADKRTGKYRGREADADLIERDVYQAQHEGRIV